MAMELNFMSVLLAVCTFLIIGLFHPLVIKTEYYFGTRPWWLWLVGGLASIVGALFISDNFLSTLLAVLGATLLWGIGELFSQKKRVEKGWFPMNPKRKDQYVKGDAGIVSVPFTIKPVRSENNADTCWQDQRQAL